LLRETTPCFIVNSDIIKLLGRHGSSLCRLIFRVSEPLVIARLLPALLLSCLFVPAVTAAPPAPARAEIDALLSRLQTSTCEFYRNGSWHSAAEAKAHLLLKFEYLAGKNAIQNTEQFIELAGSKSSLSGLPYLVKCPNETPVQSSSWLLLQLNAMRSAPRTLASNPN
jgi:hypothetical protein